jgi:hypothetical protein
MAVCYGAILTSTALAFPTSAQQVMLLRTREGSIETLHASLPKSTGFNIGKTGLCSCTTTTAACGRLIHLYYVFEPPA